MHPTVYLNWKGPQGRETVDEFTPGEGAPLDWREFRRYVSDMCAEYAMSGMPVYQSSRMCANWREESEQ